MFLSKLLPFLPLAAGCPLIPCAPVSNSGNGTLPANQTTSVEDTNTLPTDAAPLNNSGNGTLPASHTTSPEDTKTLPADVAVTPADVAVTNEEFSNLKFWVQYAGAAYCNYMKQPGDRVTCGGHCEDVEADGATIIGSMVGPVTRISAFVAVDPAREAVVVAVRGTNNLANTLADLALVLALCPPSYPFGSMAHAGFLASWGEIESAVLAAVSSALAAHPDYKITVTGHSLGGAVGTLAAASLREAHGAADLYTYGSPRVGNQPMVKYVMSLPGGNYRVTHAADPVPLVPPAILGYRHLSPEYWLVGDLTAPVYGPQNIKVCEGLLTRECNGGTDDIKVTDHSYYFQQVSACESEQSFASVGGLLGELSVEDMAEAIKADRGQAGEGVSR